MSQHEPAGQHRNRLPGSTETESAEVKHKRSNQRAAQAAGEAVTVPVAVVASRVEADLIVGMLRSRGLRAAVSADDAGGQEPQLQSQGVRVLVAASDEASARWLLEAADDAPS